MTPGLTMETFGGESIETVCNTAQEIADKLNRAVGFKFNSVLCVAMPGGCDKKLAEMQQEAQCSSMVVYSNTVKIEIEANR